MFTALLANTAAVTLLMQPGTGNTQTAGRDPLEGGWFGRSALWVEDIANNRLSHNEGGGLRKVTINTTAPHDGNSYFTVSANVSGAAKFIGMGVNSPRTGDFPFYAYRSGTGGGAPAAVHWYDSNNGSWVLNIDGTNVFRAFSTTESEFFGEVSADAFVLNTPRSEFVTATALEQTQPSAGEFFVRTHLPEGATIVQFQSTMFDANAGANMTVSLVRFTPEVTTGTVIYQVTSSGSSGGSQTPSTSTPVTPGATVVDNANYSYYIYYQGVSNISFRSARTQISVSDL